MKATGTSLSTISVEVAIKGENIMNIYEITQQALYLMQLLESDEIDEQTVSDTLEAIGTDEKIDSYCKIIRSYEDDIMSIDSEIARLTARKDMAKKNIDRMKTALDGFMQAIKKDKEKTKFFTVSYRPSEAVEVLDESLIPTEYIKVKTTTSPDKTAIKRVLSSGGTVSGCILKKKRNLQIK